MTALLRDGPYHDRVIENAPPGVVLEFPLAYRAGLFIRSYRADYGDHTVMLYRHAGLRRMDALMSDTEKRLSPERFPN